MYFRSSRYAITISIAMVCAALPPAVSAAPPTDACALLTPAQLSGALGVPMDAGKYVTPGFLRTCTWTPGGGATPGFKFLTLYLQPADAFDAGKGMLQMGQGKGAAVVISPLSGVGDDAYYANFGGSITSLFVKKGATAFKLTWYGATAPEKVMAIEKALALQVVSEF
jgi:hypothetical protein